MSNTEFRVQLKEFAQQRAWMSKSAKEHAELADKARPIDAKLAGFFERTANIYREMHDYLESRCG